MWLQEYKYPLLNYLKACIAKSKNKKNFIGKAAKLIDQVTQQKINIYQIKQDSQKTERKRWKQLKMIIEERVETEKEILQNRWEELPTELKQKKEEMRIQKMKTIVQKSLTIPDNANKLAKHLTRIEAADADINESDSELELEIEKARKVKPHHHVKIMNPPILNSVKKQMSEDQKENTLQKQMKFVNSKVDGIEFGDELAKSMRIHNQIGQPQSPEVTERGPLSLEHQLTQNI